MLCCPEHVSTGRWPSVDSTESPRLSLPLSALASLTKGFSQDAFRECLVGHSRDRCFCLQFGEQCVREPNRDGLLGAPHRRQPCVRRTLEAREQFGAERVGIPECGFLRLTRKAARYLVKAVKLVQMRPLGSHSPCTSLEYVYRSLRDAGRTDMTRM